MRAINLSDVVEAGTNSRLAAGGYVVRITSVEDVIDKEYLLVEYDIAEGKDKGYYKSLFDNKGYWLGSCIRSYKETALPMFKRFCSAVTKSNAGYIFDGNTNADEKTLVGKLMGVVLGEEEYKKNTGEIGTRLYVQYECDAEKIRKGDFKVPEKKLLNKVPQAPAVSDDFVSVTSGVAEELPFN